MYSVRPYKRNDIFRLFDDFFDTSTTIYNGPLKVDVRDLNEEYVVEVDVPGIKKEDIQIHFENERLIISLEVEESKEEDNNNYIHKERYMASSKRSIYLKDVDPTKFKAKMDNGVLTITAQKLEEKINKYMIDIE
jgi:HSP20 family protein